AQHPRQLPIAPAPPLGRELVQSGPKGRVGRPDGRVALRRPGEAGEAARPALRHLGGGHHVVDGRPPLLGRHHFFPSRSFTTCKLRAWSATIRLSWRFSSSNAFSRWASLTCRPPYFRRQRWIVVSLTP